MCLIDRKEVDGLNVLYKIHNMGEDGLGYRYVTGPKKADAIRGKFYTGVPLERIEEIKTGYSEKTRPITNFYDYSADFGNIRNEGAISFNGGKKPVKMIEELINYHINKNATILDFFAGSGTTAEAVLELNKQDGGNRKFILCTNNENNICEEITYRRIKTVITGIKKDGSKYSDGIKANLKYLKTDFVSKEHTEIQEEILTHTKELIELEHHTNLSNQEYLIIKTDKEADLLEKNINDYPNLKGLYIYSDVLLSNKQKILFKNLDIKYIPDYFYRNELCEIGAV